MPGRIQELMAESPKNKDRFIALEKKELLFAHKEAKIEALGGQLSETTAQIEHERATIQNLKNSGFTDNIPHHESNIEELLGKATSIQKEIIELASRKISSSNYTGGDSWINLIKDYFDNLQELFSHLSLEQLAALSHLLTSIFILLCMTTVISIIYGEFLLNYFKLEEKFPIIGRYIKIRRKFQHFYLFVNFFLIIAILLYVIYIDFSVLVRLS